MRLIPVVLLTVSTGALAQAAGGSTAPLTPSPGELRGPGLPVVPNNCLAPLPNPVVTDPDVAPVQRPTTAPAESAAAPTQPGEARTCPSGITFC